VEEFLDDFLGKEDAHVKCMQKYKKENLWPGDRKQGQLHNLKGDAKHDFQQETPFESRHLASWMGDHHGDHFGFISLWKEWAVCKGLEKEWLGVTPDCWFHLFKMIIGLTVTDVWKVLRSIMGSMGPWKDVLIQ
jgi:hypothetical protein